MSITPEALAAAVTATMAAALPQMVAAMAQLTPQPAPAPAPAPVVTPAVTPATAPPSNLLQYPKLTSENYHSWKYNCEIALTSRDLGTIRRTRR